MCPRAAVGAASRFLSGLLLAWGLLLLLAAGPALAQSSGCNGNEDVVTFDFGGFNSTSATASVRTWPGGNTSGSFNVATAGTRRTNTITFDISISGASWVSGYPDQGTQGGVANSLDLNMDSTAPGDYVLMRMTFNRPMNKVRFNMYDVDRSNGNWHDVLRITGSLNGNTTQVPTLVPTNPGRFSTSTVSGGSEIDTTTNGNCASTSGTCNVRIDFANPVDAIEVLFLAGDAVGSPTAQRVGFNDFSYCVPRRELVLSKVDSTPTFTAGLTGTYILSVSNQGGTRTTGRYTVTDVIDTEGVSFVNPQSPGSGWNCQVSTSSRTDDRIVCWRTTQLNNGASTNLTLTVSVSADATASVIVDRAKVFGGGDPNKTALTTTGPLADCTAASEGWRGGGADYYDGSSNNAGCAYEETVLQRVAGLTINKTNNQSIADAGSTFTYTVTIANLGPSDAPGSVFTDPESSGLDCTTVTFASNPPGSVTVSPNPLTMDAVESTGVTLSPTFPANSTATFTVQCGVTASGTP